VIFHSFLYVYQRVRVGVVFWTPLFVAQNKIGSAVPKENFWQFAMARITMAMITVNHQMGHGFQTSLKWLVTRFPAKFQLYHLVSMVNMVNHVHYPMDQLHDMPGSHHIGHLIIRGALKPQCLSYPCPENPVASVNIQKAMEAMDHRTRWLPKKGDLPEGKTFYQNAYQAKLPLECWRFRAFWWPFCAFWCPRVMKQLS
jgi:hypothetical protein